MLFHMYESLERALKQQDEPAPLCLPLGAMPLMIKAIHIFIKAKPEGDEILRIDTLSPEDEILG